MLKFKYFHLLAFGSKRSLRVQYRDALSLGLFSTCSKFDSSLIPSISSRGGISKRLNFFLFFPFYNFRRLADLGVGTWGSDMAADYPVRPERRSCMLQSCRLGKTGDRFPHRRMRSGSGGGRIFLAAPLPRRMTRFQRMGCGIR